MDIPKAYVKRKEKRVTLHCKIPEDVKQMIEHWVSKRETSVANFVEYAIKYFSAALTIQERSETEEQPSPPSSSPSEPQ